MRENNSKKLKLKWVTDVIGDDYKNWREGDTVILQAQTGTGKTYFVKNKLVPRTEMWDKMLLLCNRVALKRQLKLDLIEITNDLEAKKLVYKKDKEGKLIVNNKALDKLTTIDNKITIMSYQTLSEFCIAAKYGVGKAFDLNNYKYVVLDECHFLTSDSPFNNKTDFSYEKLLKEMNPKSIKIFISATMEELEDSIELFANENIEQLNHWGIGENKVHKYSTGINEENKTGMDYSYLNPKYFNELSDIANTIKNDKTDNKWLVFVQSFDDMNYLLEELKGINGGVASIKSGDENNINFNSIMDKNKFISRVLITTKVLDNGVNIEDDKLKNIVVMTLDRTTFIQEIGRVRIDIENAPEINLFIRKKYKKTFTTLLKKYNEKQEQIDLFNENLNLFKRKFNNDADKVKKDVIRLGRDTQWELNKIGLFRLNKDRMFAEMMEDRMRKNKFAFIEEQLSWIGLEDTFDEDNMIEDVMLEEDKMSLEGYLSSMFENKIVLLKAPDREELIKTIGLIDTHNSNLGIKKNIEANIKYVKNINTLNSYLDEEIGSKFRIKQFETSRNIEGKKKKFKNAWKIVKIIE